MRENIDLLEMVFVILNDRVSYKSTNILSATAHKGVVIKCNKYRQSDPVTVQVVDCIEETTFEASVERRSIFKTKEDLIATINFDTNSLLKEIEKL